MSSRVETGTVDLGSAWLIELPLSHPYYLRVRRSSANFIWDDDHNLALKLASREQAEFVLKAVTKLVPALIDRPEKPFVCEHGWFGRRAADEPAPILWQPISTAPRDGTFILCTNGTYQSCGNFAGGWIEIGHWGPTLRGTSHGWIDGADIGQIYPTHWQPLPNPPSPHDREGDDV